MSKYFLIFVLTIGISFLYALPESPHPYPNEYNKSEVYSNPEAIMLEVTFSAKTETEEGNDYIIIHNGAKEEVAKYTGKQLAGQTILIPGNTFYVTLTSDDTKNAYGYSIEKVRAIFASQKMRATTIDYSSCENLRDRDLIDELNRLISRHTSLGYTNARKKMFGEIDNVNGYVYCVYTQRGVKTNTIPNGNDMNCEHTWPKSKGAGSEPAKSDLYHLFPTDSVTNSRRSSYYFGNVVDTYWSKGGSELGEDKYGDRVFMPREDHRGNVARAIFYFSVKYKKRISSHEEAALRQWHKDDPVDSKERARNDGISKYQKNRNPFIDHPEYVDKISDF